MNHRKRTIKEKFGILIIILFSCFFIACTTTIPPEQKALITPENAVQEKLLIPSTSMWVWNDQVDLKNETSINNLLAFSQAHAINQLYVGINDNFFGDDQKYLKHFLTRAQKQNIDVFYLTGEADWAKTENGEEMMHHVERYLNFNKQHGEMIVGIHFDIEQGSKWFGDGNRMAKEFLQNLKRIKELYSEAHISLDIPFWLDTHHAATVFKFEGQNLTLNAHLRRYTDFLTIMAYNDEAENIIRFVQTEMDEGPTVIGIEFSDVEALNEPASITFYEEKISYFEKERDAVVAYYQTHLHFRGMAWHSYNTADTFYKRETKN